MSHKSTERNPKVRATAAIWGCAIGMLGVCIPLVAITNSGIILPLLVILGAGGGTVAVWFAPDQRQQEETRLLQTVKALEARVVNLETICISLPESSKLSMLGRGES
ncbi:MAG: hypothetical protein HY785_28985 [Oscillatoriophycideae cyanobacterium NC_groundwater_1537_Pr4_S-0.65um_50_18]|nr:hypothetical protein [Oscillatoriophycideae cyanobacterium NC_groundwater_1537_Pr4_S-0.65um_50_18]